MTLGQVLRGRTMLRVIAVERGIRSVLFAVLAVAVFLFAAHALRVRGAFYRIVTALQGGSGGPAHDHGFLHTLERAFTLKSPTLYAIGGAALAYAVLEGVEAVGLWREKRWAEYLTFVATVVFIPYEVYELTRTVTLLKVVAFVLNVAVAVYLLFAKRLFGLRRGAAERGQPAA